MAVLVTPGLMNLQAQFIAPGDSHAKFGTHLRIGHHPLMGLPTLPFVIDRLDLPERGLKAQPVMREDAVFLNAAGQVLTPPFQLQPGEEITIRLPTGANILPLWAEILVDPGELAPRAQAWLRSVGHEDALLGSRSAPPYAFAGTGLVRLGIASEGGGWVSGIRWFNAQDLLSQHDWQSIEVVNLPHPGGMRYAALQGWEALCAARRDRQAPLRRPLQDTDGAPAPMVAPAFSMSEERQRVGSFMQELAPILDDLITQPLPQTAQVINRVMTKDDGSPVSEDGTGTLKLQSLPLFLQAQLDPGVASYCGYKTLDQGAGKTPAHRFSFYRLWGVFPIPDRPMLMALDRSGSAFPTLVNGFLSANETMPRDAVERDWSHRVGALLEKLGISHSVKLPSGGYLGFTALAVADHAAPLDPVPAPLLTIPRHRHWLPASLDAPRRVTETGVNGLVGAAGLAATRRQPPSGPDYVAQNTELDRGTGRWRALIVPSLPISDAVLPSDMPAQPHQGFLSDPATGPGPFRLYAAQMDPNGRFSPWASRLGAASPRPGPPRPTLQAAYTQPAISTGSHVGQITATIPLPGPETLAPGGFPLSHAVLTARLDGAHFLTLETSVTAATQINAEPVPQPVPSGYQPPTPQDGLRIRFEGPELVPLETRKMELTAIWVDAQSQMSEPSEPARLTLHDPYPPVPMPQPDILDYAARPDATGHAWVERRWSPAGGQVHYAVYYADENRLREYLRSASGADAAALLAQLEGEADLAARAGLLRAAQALFPDYLFERLLDAVQPVPGSSDLEFRHALSGALRVLSAYKIVPESAATTARPDLTEVDTIFYAVPNSDPPAQPVIRAAQVDPAPGEPDLVVELTVTLNPDPRPGQQVRLRRTRSGQPDALMNPIIGTAAFTASDGGAQVAVFRDTGAALIAPQAQLQPFISYAYLAEAQGPPEPGSAASAGGEVPGLWSTPSAAVTCSPVPSEAPSAPTLSDVSGTALAGGTEGLTLTFTTPVNLVPTSEGPWIIRAEECPPDGPARALMDGPAQAGTSFIITAFGDVTPEGTVIKVRVIDPLGRASPPTVFDV